MWCGIGDPRRLTKLCRYYYDGWVHLLPDIDGVRIVTNDVCEFLQKVPGKFTYQSWNIKLR